MFKIGEFSKLTQVSIRMLRYYDENNLLKPAKTDPFTGYRLYSVEQIPQLQKIVFLRDIGYTVAEIAIALKNWSGDSMADQLKNKQIEVRRELAEQQQKLRRIETALDSIKNKGTEIRYNFTIKQIPSYPVISLRRVIPNYFCEELLWQELTALINEQSSTLPLTERCFAVYHDNEYKEADVDVEVCVVIAREADVVEPLRFRITESVEMMASTMVYGPYENIATAYCALAYWLTEHAGYKMKGINRQICHRGPWNEENPAYYLTEIQIELENN